MKKIAVIAPYSFLPASSGGQKLIDSFTNVLGSACTLSVIGTENNIVPDGKSYSFIPLLGQNKARYFNPFLIQKIRQYLIQQGAEILILEHPYFGWLIPFLRSISGIRIICHTHNVESLRFRSLGKLWWRLLYIYENWVLKKCDQVWCITEEDRSIFNQKMKISLEKCRIVPYGISQLQVPADKKKSKEKVCQLHDIDENKPLLFFNGVLDYKPNLEALEIILNEILPRLAKKNLQINVIIAGKNLPASYNLLHHYNTSGVVYAGFVDDIELYTRAADVLLNPVISGGGIKTKMIEALAQNTTVVSTQTGAAGVNLALCEGKLKLASNQDWDQFTERIEEAIQEKNCSTPDAFYKYFSWEEIIQRILRELPQ